MPWSRACALLFLASAAWAGPSMSTASNAITRDVDNAGGTFASSGGGAANNNMTGSIGEEVMITTSTSGGGSANNTLRSGFSEIAYYPATLVSLSSGVDITASSMTLNWPTPGYDGNLGVALAGSAYLVQIASASTLGNLNAFQIITVTVSTSAQTVGKIVGSGVTGLDPNTTYFAQVVLRDSDGNVSDLFSTDFTTCVTLAIAPSAGALEFLSVQTGSVTVAWAAPTQPAISSMSNSGYVLQASSNDFGALLPAGAPIFSSTTFSALASTLTLSLSVLGVPLDLSNTYYFQLASLNSVGASSVTTLTRLNFQILQSTGLLSLGTMDPSVARSTVSTSSMVVTNVGNWPVTIQLNASTATAGGSPWALSTSAGIETAVLMGVWYQGALGPPAVGPPASEFTSGFDTVLTTTSVISSTSTAVGNHNFQGNLNGVQIQPGTSATMWFSFTMPTSSVSLGPEKIAVSSQPLYP